MDYLSRTRLCGDHGFGRRIPRRPAPFARSGRLSGSVVRDGCLSFMQTKIPGDEPIALKKGFPWHGRRLMKPRLLRATARIRTTSRPEAGRAKPKIRRKN